MLSYLFITVMNWTTKKTISYQSKSHIYQYIYVHISIQYQQDNKHKHNLPQHDSVRISSRLLTRWIATIKGCRLGCLCSCQHRLIQSSCWWSDGCHLGVPSFHIRQTMGTPETMGASTKKTNTSKHACSKMGQCPQKRMRLQLCYAFPQLGSVFKTFPLPNHSTVKRPTPLASASFPALRAIAKMS